MRRWERRAWNRRRPDPGPGELAAVLLVVMGATLVLALLVATRLV